MEILPGLHERKCPQVINDVDSPTYHDGWLVVDDQQVDPFAIVSRTDNESQFSGKTFILFFISYGGETLIFIFHEQVTRYTHDQRTSENSVEFWQLMQEL